LSETSFVCQTHKVELAENEERFKTQLSDLYLKAALAPMPLTEAN
jgi:hypothetical protein